MVTVDVACSLEIEGLSEELRVNRDLNQPYRIRGVNLEAQIVFVSGRRVLHTKAQG